MLKNFLFFLNKNKQVDLEEVQRIDALHELLSAFDEHKKVVNPQRLEGCLQNIQETKQQSCNNEVVIYLSELFNKITASLNASSIDAKSLDLLAQVLRELLVSIHYTGDYLDRAKQLKDQLDNKKDIIQCTYDTRDLLIDYSTSLTEDHQEIYGYLTDIAEKLQSIYSEISQTQEDYFSRESMTGNINRSFQKGIEQLGQSLENSSDLDEIKSNLNNIVTALKEKVIEDVEAEEAETKILENKIAGMSNKIKLLEDHAKDLEKTIRQKHMEAITDPLTGLYNRAAYVQALEKAWMKWEKDKVPSTMLVWDIDHFKLINDRHGHAAGDKVLQSVAKKLETGVRKGDILARFGGEEFVMLLSDKSLGEGMQLAERIRELISSTEFTYKKQPLHVTISCGVASFINKDTPTKIFERADKALYKAKRDGRDRVATLKVA